MPRGSHSLATRALVPQPGGVGAQPAPGSDWRQPARGWQPARVTGRASGVRTREAGRASSPEVMRPLVRRRRRAAAGYARVPVQRKLVRKWRRVPVPERTSRGRRLRARAVPLPPRRRGGESAVHVPVQLSRRPVRKRRRVRVPERTSRGRRVPVRTVRHPPGQRSGESAVHALVRLPRRLGRKRRLARAPERAASAQHCGGHSTGGHSGTGGAGRLTFADIDGERPLCAKPDAFPVGYGLPEVQGTGAIALLQGHLDKETRNSGRCRFRCGDVVQCLT